MVTKVKGRPYFVFQALEIVFEQPNNDDKEVGTTLDLCDYIGRHTFSII